VGGPGGTLSTGVGLFVPKPTPFVVYLANVLLGLQLGVWLRPPMSGIGTARCYSVGYSSAWRARYRITRRYCTRSAATNQRDASRAWMRSANGRRGRNSCTSRLRDGGAWGSLRPRAGRRAGPADWAVSGRTRGTTWQPPHNHWVYLTRPDQLGLTGTHRTLVTDHILCSQYLSCMLMA
jgi:hypothetical protein